MEAKNKRRLYPIVNSTLQYRFLALILIYCLIFVATLGAFLFVPDILTLQDQTQDIHTRAFAADKILTFHSRIWPAVILLVVLIGSHSFREFHRIVGPLYVFSRAFKNIGNGDLGFRVQIRKKDYLHPEKEDINRMMDLVSGKMRGIQTACDHAQLSFQRLQRHLKSENKDTPDWNEYLISFHRDLDEMVSALKQFKLPNASEKSK